MPDSPAGPVYHNRRTAERYDRQGGFAPGRKAKMLDVALDLLLTLTAPGSTLLELGAGTGHYTRHILATRHFGLVQVTDGSTDMLDIARDKLQGTGSSLRFQVLDFTEEWADRFAGRPFDAVTSTMALHHAQDKPGLFRQLFRVLKPGGVLVLGDHMAAASELGDYLIGRERALVVLGPEGGSHPERVRELVEMDRQRGMLEDNHCESVPAYLAALEACGFESVDCLWQDYWLAVIIAVKPGTVASTNWHHTA